MYEESNNYNNGYYNKKNNFLMSKMILNRTLINVIHEIKKI